MSDLINFLSKMIVFFRFSFIFANDSTYYYDQVGTEPVSPKLSEHLKKEILDSLSKNLDEIFKVLDTPTTH